MLGPGIDCPARRCLGVMVLCVSQPYAFEDGLLRFLAMAWFHGL